MARLARQGLLNFIVVASAHELDKVTSRFSWTRPAASTISLDE
jgi:hypothetical protein